jgi:hypothetical protein
MWQYADSAENVLLAMFAYKGMNFANIWAF